MKKIWSHTFWVTNDKIFIENLLLVSPKTAVGRTKTQMKTKKAFAKLFGGFLRYTQTQKLTLS